MSSRLLENRRRVAVKNGLAVLILLVAGLGTANSQLCRTKMSVAFAPDEVVVDTLHFDNAARVHKIVDYLRAINEDPSIDLVEISLCGAASPEGSYQLNRRLANERLEALENIMRSEVDVPDSLISRRESYISWDLLREQVVASDMEYRQEVLDIIDQEPRLVDYYGGRNIDHRVVALKKLNGGKVWRELYEPYFEEMRNACVVVVTYKHQMPEPQPEPEVQPQPSIADLIYTPEDPTEEIETFERDIRSTVFIPKGQWAAGISVNYSQSTQNDYQFLIIEDIKGDTYSFKVTPMVCYFVKDDMGVGGKFGYSRNLTKLESANIVLDSETNYNVNDLYSLSHNYYGMAIMRNYFSLGMSKRFGFFNEIQLQVGGGQSKLTQGRGGDIIGSYQRNFSVDVGLAPGIIMFLNNYSALEVNIGVLGFSYNHTKQISNQIYEANLKSNSANFRLNLMSIAFGVSFYL